MLLVMLLDIPGTTIVSQRKEKLNQAPREFLQHLGGLLEPRLLCGCC